MPQIKKLGDGQHDITLELTGGWTSTTIPP